MYVCVCYGVYDGVAACVRVLAPSGNFGCVCVQRVLRSLALEWLGHEGFHPPHTPKYREGRANKAPRNAQYCCVYGVLYM